MAQVREQFFASLIAELTLAWLWHDKLDRTLAENFALRKLFADSQFDSSKLAVTSEV